MTASGAFLREVAPELPRRDYGGLRLAVAGQDTPADASVDDRKASLELAAADRVGLDAHIEAVDRLTRVCEFRDDATHHHSQRIGRAARIIAEAMGLGSTFAALLEQAAPLHDIGKVGIPDAILLKPGRLTPQEREEMEQHTFIGQKILSGGTTEVVRMAEMVALSHHERWDGGGYPEGLFGDETPIGARIVAVVDVFDALTHERPYKRAWPLCEAVAHIVAGAGTHFDPAVVAAFRTVDPCDLLGDCDER